MSLANNIRTMREQQGLTQEELAKKVGVTQQAVDRYERGFMKPNIVVGVTLAKVLRTTCEELVGDKPAG